VIRLKISADAEGILSEGIKLLKKYIRPGTENDELIRSLLPHATAVWRETIKYKQLTLKYKYFEDALSEKEEFFEGSIWFECQDPVDSFIGREADLKSLHACLNPVDGASPLATVLCGPFGIGKRELVRKYASAFSKSYADNVIWLDGTTLSSLNESLSKLAMSLLGVAEDTAKDMSIPELFQTAYDHFKKRKKKSLIIINVSDFDVLRILPKAKEFPKPAVLIISTAPYYAWEKRFKVNGIDLRRLNPNIT
jgi:hypothetical protein